MKVSDLNNEVKKLKEVHSPSEKKSSDPMRNMLSTLFDVIERCERGGLRGRDNKDKVDVLKTIISDMVKDKEQKQIIKGDG